MNAINIKSLKKFYGNRLVLDDVNLSVPRGVVFALLGPNGAGKTTLLKSILGITRFKEGAIEIFEKTSNSYESHKCLAYFPEKFNFFPYFTVDGVLKFYGKMYGVSHQDLGQQIDKALDKVEIMALKNRRISQISKGELQRVGIASILLAKAEFYIFDEPFYGLDPIGIKIIKDIFQELASCNKTVFINSHILGEVEKIASEIAIINKGKILFSGNVNTFINGRSLEDSFYSIIKGVQA